MLNKVGLLKTARLRLFIAWAFVMFCAHIGLSGAYYYDDNSVKNHGSSIQIDWDTVDFTAEIERTPHLSDVLKWWSGPWMQKVPYFRPLTMTAFWTEYQLYGKDGRVAFQWTHRLWHLAFLTLLLAFLTNVAGIKRAALATGLFAIGWNQWLGLPTGVDAFNCWKDQCDVWSIMTNTAACFSLWRWLASRSAEGRENTDQWWKEAGWWRTVAIFVLGLTIKETGMLAPLYLTLTLWMAGKLRQNWIYVLPFYFGSVAWWLLRFMALDGWGHKTGNGNGWPVRFAGQALGLPSSIISGDGFTIAMPGLIVGVVLLYLWRHDFKNKLIHKWLFGWLIVMCLSIWKGITYMPDETLNDNIVRFLEPNSWNDVLALLPILAGFSMMIWQLRRGEKIAAFGWLWVLIGFIPLIIQPPTSSHVHYPIAPGWSLWAVCGAFSLVEFSRLKIKARIKDNSRPAIA